MVEGPRRHGRWRAPARRSAACGRRRRRPGRCLQRGGPRPGPPKVATAPVVLLGADLLPADPGPAFPRREQTLVGLPGPSSGPGGSGRQCRRHRRLPGSSRCRRRSPAIVDALAEVAEGRGHRPGACWSEWSGGRGGAGASLLERSGSLVAAARARAGGRCSSTATRSAADWTCCSASTTSPRVALAGPGATCRGRLAAPALRAEGLPSARTAVVVAVPLSGGEPCPIPARGELGRGGFRPAIRCALVLADLPRTFNDARARSVRAGGRGRPGALLVVPADLRSLRRGRSGGRSGSAGLDPAPAGGRGRVVAGGTSAAARRRSRRRCSCRWPRFFPLRTRRAAAAVEGTACRPVPVGAGAPWPRAPGRCCAICSFRPDGGPHDRPGPPRRSSTGSGAGWLAPAYRRPAPRWPVLGA